MPEPIVPRKVDGTLPGQEPWNPTKQAAQKFAVFNDSSPYPSNVSKTLEQFIQTGKEVWKAPNGRYYEAVPSEFKSTKENRTFYVSVNEYTSRPGVGESPAKTYRRAYWVDQKVGEFQNHDLVYYIVNGEKVADPSLDYTPPPHSVPNNFAQFAKDDPKLFEKFYKAFILGMAIRMMRQLRKNQAKMKEAMHQSLQGG